MTKKITAFVVSITLLIASLGLNAFNGNVAEFGEGNGTNASVKDTEDLIDLLSFLTREDPEAATSLIDSEESVTRLSQHYNNDKEGKNVKSSKKAKHTSATVHISTDYSTSYDSTSAQITNVSHSKSHISRELYIYINEKDTFYRTSGTMASESSYYDQKNKTSFFRWDMDICILNDSVYILLREFIMTENEDYMKIKEENKGKWIECGFDLIDAFVDIDYANREVFSMLSMLMEQLRDKELLDATQKEITLNEDDFVKFAEEDGEETDMFDDMELDFNVDITNEKNPMFSSVAIIDKTADLSAYDPNYNYDSGYKYPSTPPKINYTVTQNTKSVMKISIKNIDNTIIDFDKSAVKIIADKERSFEKLFDIKETKKNDN